MFKSLGIRVGAVALLALTPLVAQAQGWSGAQAGALTGYNPFSVVGNQLIVTSGGDSFLTSAGAGLSGNLLLGIRGVWLIDTTTFNPIAGLTLLGGGVATGTGSSIWSLTDDGYTAPPPPGGFGSGGRWITVNDVTLAGKTPTGYTDGAFLFNPFPTDYYIGIDYLVDNGGAGQTGRMYFTSLPDDRIGVPEPGEWAAMGVLGAGLAGLVVRARRKRA